MSTDPKNSDPAEETVKNAPATSESETEPSPADALSDEALDGVSGGGQYWQEFDNG